MDLFLFDKNKDVIDIITPDSIYESEQTTELNGLITHTVSGVYVDAVEDAEFFGMKDVDDNGIFWRYKVSGLRKSDGHFTLDGTYELFDDLKSRTVIQDKRPQNQSALNALNTLLEGTTWEGGNVSSERVATSNWYYISPLEAFWDYLEKWNVEFKPRMIYSGGKVIRKVIDISDRLSDDYGKWYEYGSDLLTVVAEEDKANIYTAFIGRGKGEETDAGGYGRRLTIEEVEWNTANGDLVDKPLGQDYIEIPEATELYSYEDGTPRFTTVTFEDIDDRNELIRATYDYAVQEARPKAQFKATVHEDGVAEVGEIVTIIRDDLNIRYKTRVFKLTRNFLNKRIKQLEFGDELVQSRAKQSKAIADRFNKKIEETNIFWLDALREAITDSYFNNDGYNYDLQADNKYGLPGGYYSFDRPIDENPTKAIYMGAGSLLISNEKNPNGEWVWRTALNGEGIMADWIVGQNSEFVRSSWNTALGESTYIDGNEIKSTGADGEEISIGNGALNFYNRDGQHLVWMEPTYSDKYAGEVGFGINLRHNRQFNIIRRKTTAPDEVIMQINPLDEHVTFLNDVTVGRLRVKGTNQYLLSRPEGGVSLIDSHAVRLGIGRPEGWADVFTVNENQIADLFGRLRMNDNLIADVSELEVNDRAYIRRSRASNYYARFQYRDINEFHIFANGGLLLGEIYNNQWERILQLLHGGINAFRDINMNGNAITNQSDIRLKTNIEDSNLDALKEIERLRFIEFDWDETNPANKDKPSGRNFGLIAQYTPFLQTIPGDEESYLSIDVTKQVNLNSKGIQEMHQELKATKQELKETKQELADLKALLTEKGLI